MYKLVFVLLLFSINAQASVTIDRTRIVLIQNQPGEVVIKNKSGKVKSVSMSITDENGASKNGKVLLTPNFVKLEPNESRVIRFFSIEEDLKEGHLYYFNMNEEPESDGSSSKKGLKVVLSSRIKVFVKTSKENPKYDDIDVSCGTSSRKLVIRNKSNNFISINKITYKGITMSDEYSLSEIKPNGVSLFKSQIDCPIESSQSSTPIEIEFINEFGGKDVYSAKMSGLE